MLGVELLDAVAPKMEAGAGAEPVTEMSPGNQPQESHQFQFRRSYHCRVLSDDLEISMKSWLLEVGAINKCSNWEDEWRMRCLYSHPLVI